MINSNIPESFYKFKLHGGSGAVETYKSFSDLAQEVQYIDLKTKLTEKSEINENDKKQVLRDLEGLKFAIMENGEIKNKSYIELNDNQKNKVLEAMLKYPNYGQDDLTPAFEFQILSNKASLKFDNPEYEHLAEYKEALSGISNGEINRLHYFDGENNLKGCFLFDMSSANVQNTLKAYMSDVSNYVFEKKIENLEGDFLVMELDDITYRSDDSRRRVKLKFYNKSDSLTDIEMLRDKIVKGEGLTPIKEEELGEFGLKSQKWYNENKKKVHEEIKNNKSYAERYFMHILLREDFELKNVEELFKLNKDAVKELVYFAVEKNCNLDKIKALVDSGGDCNHYYNGTIPYFLAKDKKEVKEYLKGKTDFSQEIKNITSDAIDKGNYDIFDELIDLEVKLDYDKLYEDIDKKLKTVAPGQRPKLIDMKNFLYFLAKDKKEVKEYLKGKTDFSQEIKNITSDAIDKGNYDIFDELIDLEVKLDYDKLYEDIDKKLKTAAPGQRPKLIDMKNFLLCYEIDLYKEFELKDYDLDFVNHYKDLLKKGVPAATNKAHGESKYLEKLLYGINLFKFTSIGSTDDNNKSLNNDLSRFKFTIKGNAEEKKFAELDDDLKEKIRAAGDKYTQGCLTGQLEIDMFANGNGLVSLYLSEDLNNDSAENDSLKELSSFISYIKGRENNLIFYIDNEKKFHGYHMVQVSDLTRNILNIYLKQWALICGVEHKDITGNFVVVRVNDPLLPFGDEQRTVTIDNYSVNASDYENVNDIKKAITEDSLPNNNIDQRMEFGKIELYPDDVKFEKNRQKYEDFVKKCPPYAEKLLFFAIENWKQENIEQLLALLNITRGEKYTGLDSGVLAEKTRDEIGTCLSNIKKKAKIKKINVILSLLCNTIPKRYENILVEDLGNVDSKKINDELTVLEDINKIKNIYECFEMNLPQKYKDTLSEGLEKIDSKKINDELTVLEDINKINEIYEYFEMDLPQKYKDTLSEDLEKIDCKKINNELTVLEDINKINEIYEYFEMNLPQKYKDTLSEDLEKIDCKKINDELIVLVEIKEKHEEIKNIYEYFKMDLPQKYTGTLSEGLEKIDSKKINDELTVLEDINKINEIYKYFEMNLPQKYTGTLSEELEKIDCKKINDELKVLEDIKKINEIYKYFEMDLPQKYTDTLSEGLEKIDSKKIKGELKVLEDIKGNKLKTLKKEKRNSLLAGVSLISLPWAIYLTVPASFTGFTSNLSSLWSQLLPVSLFFIVGACACFIVRNKWKLNKLEEKLNNFNAVKDACAPSDQLTNKPQSVLPNELDSTSDTPQNALKERTHDAK